MTIEPKPVDNADGDKKKKKRVIVTPPCPAAVSTAYLVLRGAIHAVVGTSMTDVTVSGLQPTYIKEQPKQSGKFSVTLGKKLGDGELALPEDERTEGIRKEDVLAAIQATANRLVTENRAISCASLTKQQVEAELPNGVLNQTHNKTKPDENLTVANIDGCVLAVPPSTPYATINGQDGRITEIVVEQGNQCSDISCGKKSRKDAQITIKFHVVTTSQDEEKQGVLAVIQPSKPIEWTADSFAALCQATVQCPEGQALLERQKQALAAAETTSAPVANVVEPEDEEMVVNTCVVKGKIDYTKLVKDFGSQLITPSIRDQLVAHTVDKGRVPHLHRFLRRDIFFSHRDLEPMLTAMQTGGKPVYLYTGRGPSSSAMHLGHLVPFLFTQWLQEALDCPLVIQMTDDEKFIFKGEYQEQEGDNLDHFASLTMENARDIIACGFDYNKTFLFSDLDYVGGMYPNIVRIWKAVTTNTVNGIFGFDGSSNIGKIAFPAIQAAPSFASSFPNVLKADRSSPHMCLIPCAIDQDPYFRMTRDVAHKLVLKPKPGSNDEPHALNGKPALIHSKFFPPLQGATGKMSSSDTNSAVFLTDTPEDIERKIKSFAFSGGRETKKEQEEHGANLEIDVSYQWLRFFLEDDDLLEKIGKDYGSGSGEYWSTGKVKQKLIEVLQELVAAHQERRAKITDDEVRKWMKERSIVG